MLTPFDHEVTLDSNVECLYEVDVGTLRTADDAQQLVTSTRARVADGRRLRPNAEHNVIVLARAAMPRAIRDVLFPSLGENVDSLSVSGYPSWLADEAKLVPERARLHEESWHHIASAYESLTSLTASVTERVAGGLLVDVGRPAFLPEDQIDLLPVMKLERLIGRKLEVRVIQFDMRADSLVVSRRVILEERRDEIKKQTLPKVHEGASLRGRICTLTPYGAFVDLGGITALLHVSNIPAFSGRMPAEILAIGDEVTVSVLSYRPDSQWITLGLPAPAKL